MIKISKILVPYDFSEMSSEALRYGASLALKFDAQLTIAHIIPSFTAFNYAFPGDTFEFEKMAFEEARKQLPAAVPEAYRDRLRSQTIVKAGDVRDELLEIAESEHADLVVMGTHGRRSLERFILGSTTEGLLRRVGTPLLTVSPQPADKSASPFEVPFKRILYATDLSEATATGLHYCVEFARAFSSQLFMLHVMDLRGAVTFGNEADIHARLMGQLHKAVGKEHCKDLHVKTDVVSGTPHSEILKFADHANADLIVIHLQSKGALERAFLGSTAERVIRSSPVPVLAVPGNLS